MIRFSKRKCLFAVVAIICILIFMVGLMELSAQTPQDSVVEENQSLDDTTKKDGFLSSDMNLKEIILFLVAILVVFQY